MRVGVFTALLSQFPLEKVLEKLNVGVNYNTEQTCCGQPAFNAGIWSDCKAIGEKLFISPLTVRKHVANIYEKLHVNSRAQIINLAHKHKWI